MIAVAIPDMAKSLGESPLRLNLVIATYLLSLAVFIPVSGWIADRLGTRAVFCAAIAIFAAGSALCGVVDEPADDAGHARGARLWRRDDDPGRAAYPAAQLSALGSRLGDELDDDPGDDRADRGSDRRRISDDLSFLARDLLSQRADRRCRCRAGLVADRGFSRAGADAFRSARLFSRRHRARPARTRHRKCRTPD